MRRILTCRHKFSTQEEKILTDYKQRGHRRAKIHLKPGQKVSSFEVQSQNRCGDFNLTHTHLQNPTNTNWHHFDSQIISNTMVLLFKYPASIPNPIRYALQKTLQCGSKTYPIHHPIQHMLSRSFNKQDFTTTTNDFIYLGWETNLLKDYEQLMDVYMSMIMEPRMTEEDFKEVVWRYRLAGGTIDVMGDLVEENKQAWQFNQTAIYDTIQTKLFQRQGIPCIQQLTTITYPDLIKAHHHVFNPNNLTLFTHGDLHPTLLIPKYQQILEKYSHPPVHFDESFQTKPPHNNLQTFTIEQLERAIPVMLCFRIPQHIPSFDRFLLAILSYLLFDMPESQMMRWNTPSTPYPKLYGYHHDYFNVGITLPADPVPTEKMLMDVEKQIRENLNKLYKNKFPDGLVQKCLLHLQGGAYRENGVKIIDGVIEAVLQEDDRKVSERIGDVLKVKKNISKLLRDYRKMNIFQELMHKYLFANPNYIRIWGKNNPDLFQKRDNKLASDLKEVYKGLTEEDLEKISSYAPPTLLQNTEILPKLKPQDLELFSHDQLPEPVLINDVPVSYSPIPSNIKITTKIDITDIDEQQIKLLPILCEVFPFMGIQGYNPQAYQQYLQMYIKNIEMKYQAVKVPNGMKIFLFLEVQFTERNLEYGFNVVNGLLNNPDSKNISTLSSRIQRVGNDRYNNISENLIEYHGRFVAGMRSPFAMVEDPLFAARSVCSLASDLLKIANPKSHLESIASQLSFLIHKFQEKNRISILYESPLQHKAKYLRYLQLTLSPLKTAGTKPNQIGIKNYEPLPCMKYFPNYEQQCIFEAFTVPYFTNPQQIPPTLVLSTIIDTNIKRYNKVGGCFTFKGAMIAYMNGSKNKFMELESYYSKLDDVEAAKMLVFKQFQPYTSRDYFYTHITQQQMNQFKQALALVQPTHVKQCLEQHILPSVKQATSSLLILGHHVQNYQPLIKKGWQIERVIEDMSMKMQSNNQQQLPLSTTKYINIY